MTLDEAKAYMRLETTQEDALIERLIASAITLCEAFLGQRLIRGDVIETVPASGVWQRLSASPVTAITGVASIDGQGNVSELPVGGFAIDIDPAGDGWVRTPGGGRLRVSYRAGIADDLEGVPAAIGQGVIRLVAHLHTHRDAAAEPPAAIAALWRPFRRVRLGLEWRA